MHTSSSPDVKQEVETQLTEDSSSGIKSLFLPALINVFFYRYYMNS